ncbi:MAG: transcriptional regulator [Pseudohongiella sp.]|nr:MAG: transcriptional regulator [Pseudohongiella sp.]
MNQLSNLLAILAFSQLIFIAVFFLVHNHGTLTRLISLYCFCLSTYVLAYMPYFADSLLSIYLLFRLATLAPFILWIVAFTLFVDNGKIHPGVWLAIVFFELTRGIGIAIFYLNPATVNDISFIIVQIIPQAIMLAFAAHTLYLAYQGYSADLLEQRRRVRVIFLLIMGVLLVTVVGSDFIDLFSRFLLEPGQSILPDMPNYFISIYIFVMTFLFSQLIFSLDEDATALISISSGSESKPRKNGERKSNVDPSLLEKIREAMEVENLYTKTGLTIADLAEKLSIQEYRLRRVINQQLQFKNFNQFLNNYRIEDACSRLRDTSTPISTIALEVGYASLSVFNKAFKERYGITPSEFRNKENRDS